MTILGLAHKGIQDNAFLGRKVDAFLMTTDTWIRLRHELEVDRVIVYNPMVKANELLGIPYEVLTTLGACVDRAVAMAMAGDIGWTLNPAVLPEPVEGGWE